MAKQISPKRTQQNSSTQAIVRPDKLTVLPDSDAGLRLLDILERIEAAAGQKVDISTGEATALSRQSILDAPPTMFRDSEGE